MSVMEDKRGKTVILRKLPCVNAITKILCRRNHEFKLVDRESHTECDGVRTVCGMCAIIAHRIFDAIEKEGSKR
jgi:hypothetical protein